MSRRKRGAQKLNFSYHNYDSGGGRQRKNNGFGSRNRTWGPRVMKPMSILLRHSDLVEAIWIWKGVHGHAKLDKIIPPSV